MEGVDAGPVQDLLAAGGARRGDDGARTRLADGREQDHLADGHRGRIMLLLITERTCHTTTATGDDRYFRIQQLTQYLSHHFNADDCLLVAMTVEENLNRSLIKTIAIDMASLYLSQ